MEVGLRRNPERLNSILNTGSNPTEWALQILFVQHPDIVWIHYIWVFFLVSFLAKWNRNFSYWYIWEVGWSQGRCNSPNLDFRDGGQFWALRIHRHTCNDNSWCWRHRQPTNKRPGRDLETEEAGTVSPVHDCPLLLTQFRTWPATIRRCRRD